jgi:transketolase
MNTVPLNPKLFDDDVERAPIRKGFGEGLLDAAERDHRIVGLSADLTESTMMHLFAKRFPERFVQAGIAEQSMASVASGMAAMGKIPFLSSYAAFSPGRNWEQIRTTIAYNDTNCKIVGSHSGIVVGPDGGTHQALEDIALMRVIPRMTVIAPCDSIEAKKATLAIAAFSGPVYLRLVREATPIITTDSTPFEIGKARVLFVPKVGFSPQAALITTGGMAYNTLLAARALERDGVGVSVLHMATIKPFDEEAVLAVAKEAGAVVSVEDHQQTGGLGSAIAEFLSKTHPTRQAFVGIDDRFGQSGTPEELVEHYGLGVTAIVAAVKRVIAQS